MAMPKYGPLIKCLSLNYSGQHVDAHAADILISAPKFENLRIRGPWTDSDTESTQALVDWPAEEDQLIHLLEDSQGSSKYLPCLRSCKYHINPS